MDLLDVLAIALGVPFVSWLAGRAIEYMTDWFHDWQEGIEE